MELVLDNKQAEWGADNISDIWYERHIWIR